MDLRAPRDGRSLRQPGGVVDVRLSQEQGRVALEVVDTGPGIPQELLPRVFDRFFRVPGNGVNGSGLGLAIAQAAVKKPVDRIDIPGKNLVQIWRLQR